jgi:hypothetical protein
MNSLQVTYTFAGEKIKFSMIFDDREKNSGIIRSQRMSSGVMCHKAVFETKL